jgi:hypothetical protein
MDVIKKTNNTAGSLNVFLDIFWKALKLFLLIVGIVANILFVLGLMWALFCFIIIECAPARLPNGYALHPVWFDRYNVRLVDPEGNEIVPAHVSGIGWCDEIVYGTHYTQDGPERGRSFIYDGKKHELKYIDFSPYGAGDVRAYGIPRWPENLKSYGDIDRAAPKVSCPGRE